MLFLVLIPYFVVNLDLTTSSALLSNVAINFDLERFLGLSGLIKYPHPFSLELGKILQGVVNTLDPLYKFLTFPLRILETWVYSKNVIS